MNKNDGLDESVTRNSMVYPPGLSLLAMSRSPLASAWPVRAGVSALLSLVVGGIVTRWIKVPPYDDPFITFRYAANLRDGLGLVFNPGEPVLSTTTPLFALLLGVLGTLLPAVDIATLGYWTSLIALIIAGGLASAICWQEAEYGAAVLAPFAVMLAPTLVQSVGQETSLLLAFGFASFFFWRRQRRRLAAAALGLLALTRPDGVVLAVILLAAEVYRSRGIPYSAGILFALIVGPWYLYAWAAYGSPFPFSLTAKVAQAQTGWWQPTGPALWVWLRWAVQQTPLTFVLVAVGLGYALRSARWGLLLLGWPVLQLLGYGLLGVAFYQWYAAPFHSILGLIAALGAGRFSRLASQVGLRWWPVPVVAFLLAALAITIPGVQYARAYGRSVPDAKMQQYEAIGRWLHDHTDQNSLVAALEMGRLGYFSQRPMFDFVGLVKPPVAEHLRQKDLIWSIKTYRPDYIVTIPPDRWLLADRWFLSSYAPLKQFADPSVYQGEPTVVFVRAVGEPPAQSPSHIVDHRFGGRIALVGYSVDQTSIGDGNVISIVLHWRARQPIEKDFTVYVHALDQGGRLVAQADGQPLRGQWPTSKWRPGETVLDPREIRIPQGSTVTRLHVGWYLLETMQRLPGEDYAGRPAESVVISIR